jgi:hypothetical protein
MPCAAPLPSIECLHCSRESTCSMTNDRVANPAASDSSPTDIEHNRVSAARGLTHRRRRNPPAIPHLPTSFSSTDLHLRGAARGLTHRRRRHTPPPPLLFHLQACTFGVELVSGSAAPTGAWAVGASGEALGEPAAPEAHGQHWHFNVAPPAGVGPATHVAVRCGDEVCRCACV